jgi:hypothetical protein
VGNSFTNATLACDKEDNYQEAFYYCIMKANLYSLFQIEKDFSIAKWLLNKLFITNIICPLPFFSDNPCLLLR